MVYASTYILEYINFLILTNSFDLNSKFLHDSTSKNRKHIIMLSEFQALRSSELFFVFEDCCWSAVKSW